MGRKIKLTEENLINLIEQVMDGMQPPINLEEPIDELPLDDEYVDDEAFIEDEEEEEEEEPIDDITPTVEQLEEYIMQLDSRINYIEELEADVLEFLSTLVKDLDSTEDVNIMRTKSALNFLENRADRRIFYLKSRRLQ
mgnify:FL=1|jgi:hypothetical protein